jgi:hypothetical protein
MKPVVRGFGSGYSFFFTPTSFLVMLRVLTGLTFRLTGLLLAGRICLNLISTGVLGKFSFWLIPTPARKA